MAGIHGFLVNYATSVTVQNFNSIRMELDRINASKYGDAGNEEAFLEYLERLLINTEDITALAVGTELSFAHDTGLDKFTVTFQALKSREQRMAFLQIVRFLGQQQSDDSTIVAAAARQTINLVAPALDKLVYKTPASVGVLQSGNNIDLVFFPISIANGGTEDYPDGATGLDVYEQMVREFLYFHTAGGINLGTFASSGWITGAFDTPISPTEYKITFAADTTERRNLTYQIAGLAEAGIHNTYKQLRAAGVALV